MPYIKLYRLADKLHSLHNFSSPKEGLKMGAEGLEPSRPFKVNGFSPSHSFRCCHAERALRIGPSLYPRLDVRVAPVGPLHLPCKRTFASYGAWLRIALSSSELTNEDLGFPEFESFHLADFSTKAQFSKSAASTIPPRPL